jgi:hypothetical protein
MSTLKNQVKVIVSNNTGIANNALYVFITDGNNQFYNVDAANKWVATPQSTVCNVLVHALPSYIDAAGNTLHYFYIDATANISGGRIWFSTSNTALSINSAGGVVQPTALSDFVFDFVELATNGSVNGTGGNANIDVTQVDELGIPFTLFVNPEANNLQFPPAKPTTTPAYGFPNVLGIVPWLSLEKISKGFTDNIKNTPYQPFSACVWNSGSVNRFVAPVHLINDYASGTTPGAMATFLDTAIYKFFNYYMDNSLTLQDPVSLNYYTGQVTTVSETDTLGNTSTYNVLQFDCGSEKLNIYFPYFNTNCSAFPGTLHKNVTLSPPPSWWTGNLDAAMPATAMALGCAGAFADSSFQSGVTNSILLGNLENQVVSLLNRGLSPAINNLIQFNAQFSAADIVNNQVSITTGLPAGATFAPGMNIIKQLAAQPTTVVSAATVGPNPVQIVITSTVDALNPVNTCQFICGQFYPATTADAASYSNIYSNYLHNGFGTAPAPLLNNIGYGYAYDDQGGYSNDITVDYDSNNALTLGIFLGPLTD